MESWSRVKWSEAAQVVHLLPWAEADIVVPVGGTPRDYFAALRGAGQDAQACFFLAQALPRLESVAWAARSVRDLAASPAQGPAGAALKAALLWVQDPSEDRRRAAQAAGMAAPDDCPERYAALAAFFSGGSIAPPELQAVQPAREISGRLAAGAVVIAAARTGRITEALPRCLDAGARMATEGLSAAE